MRAMSFTTIHRRRGAILLIVLTLLALFAVIGLIFVGYSQSQATSAAVRRSGIDTTSDAALSAGGLGGSGGYPGSPADAVNTALRYLIYPGNDTANDLLVAVRGYEMARMVYGHNTNPGELNCIAYNGHGTFSEPNVVAGLDRNQVVNYSFINGGFLDPERTGVRTDQNTPHTGSYVGRNAPYTYPDRNNLYVAVLDPVSGLVRKPSFHSPQLFDLATAPNTGDWTGAAGRYKLLRPRPADHNGFPYPPANPDGTVTGDVQNLVFPNGRQRMDSVWLDFNLPVVDYNGRKVKPLIAPLILPLDGSINLNAAGNLVAGGVHDSNLGFGPWEMDLSKVLIGTDIADPLAEAAKVVQKRYGGGTVPQPRGSTVDNAYFHPPMRDTTGAVISGFRYPSTPVDWDGTGGSQRMSLPGQSSYPMSAPQFASSPFWPNADSSSAGPYDSTSIGLDSSMPSNPIAPGSANENYRHPSLYNPYHWDLATDTTPATSPLSFPILDLRQIRGRYSDLARNYDSPYLGRHGFESLFGEAAGSGPNKPADFRRSLVTTISNSLARPGLAPNYVDGTAVFGLDTGATNLFPYLSAAATFSTTPSAQDWNDLHGTSTTIRNVRAAFGAIDLNRPLTDYRNDINQPLSDSNIRADNLARDERQQFAEDIFARLVIATGAAATVDKTTGKATPHSTATVDTAQYDGLRWLAQLAANIVDYIDNDDVSTTFVWNPAVPGQPFDAGDSSFSDDGTIRNRVVFGVEKPRLLLNEVYAELANAPADWTGSKAAEPLQARFFIELLNPDAATSDPSSAKGSAVKLKGYKVQVVYDSAIADEALFPQFSSTPDDAKRNVAGWIDPSNLKIDCELDDLAKPDGSPLTELEPNDGQFAAEVSTGKRNGFLVIGPTNNNTDEAPPADAIAFDPSTAAGQLFEFMGIKTGTAQDQLSYEPDPNAANIPYGTENDGTTDGIRKFLTDATNGYNNKTHTVMLRRLANPYAAASSSNPYITVDVFSYVSLADAVRVGNDDDNGLTLQEAKRAMPPSKTANVANGRVEPLAGGGIPSANYPTTMVLPQVNGDDAAAQQHSFFKHNSEEAIGNPPMPPTTPSTTVKLSTPFHWMTHPDRYLINSLELLQVSAVKPYELSRTFIKPDASTPQYYQHDLTTAMGLGKAENATNPTPLFRALELLTVKPWSYATPNGGRVPGKVNINMVWDKRVFDAVLNPQDANKFDQTELDTIWNQLLASRTPNWTASQTVGSTFDETGAAGSDRPFKPFGSAMFSGAGGIQDTLLRGANPFDTTIDQPPAFFLQTTAPNGDTRHPYEQSEALRKAFNNFTTTSDTYLVIMTVGWFEVHDDANDPFSGTPPKLGAEVFSTVPGDLRTKFAAVIDRTQIGVDHAGTQVGGVCFSELAANTPAGSTQLVFPASPGGANEVILHSEGKSFTIKANEPDKEWIRLGTGDGPTTQGDGEWVQVNRTDPTAIVFDPASGLATVKLEAVTQYPHPAGSPVSNAFLRNPGAIAFDYTDPKFQGIVPFVTEMRPTQ